MARPETKVLEMRIKECVGVEITRDAKRSVYVQNAGNSTVNAYHTAGEPANLSCHAGGGTRVHWREFQCLRVLGYRTRPVAATAWKNNPRSSHQTAQKDAISSACPVPLTLFSYPVMALVNTGLAAPYLEPAQHYTIVLAH